MKFSVYYLAFILISLKIQAQTYVPFPDYGAVWQEVLKPYPPGPMPSYLEHNQYAVSGDTLINNTSYIKLYKTQYDVNCSQFYNGPFFTGGLRNDTTARKVYFLNAFDSQEYLLYDFSLEVGDIVPQTFNNTSYPNLLVDSIDSVFIGDRYRKRFLYQEPFMDPIEVIEGIGAGSGLLEYMYQFELIYYLRCFHQNDSIYWINTYWAGTSCHLETDTCLAISVPEITVDKGFLEIYPNPARKLILIHYNFPGTDQSNDIRLEVYDVFGEKFRESLITGSNDEVIYDVSGLTNGIYILTINQGLSNSLNKKFLVAK